MFSFPLSVDGYCLFKRKIKLRWEAAFVTNSFSEYLKSLTVDKINNRRIHLMQHIEILMCSYIQLFNVKNCSFQVSLSKVYNQTTKYSILNLAFSHNLFWNVFNSIQLFFLLTVSLYLSPSLSFYFSFFEILHWNLFSCYNSFQNMCLHSGSIYDHVHDSRRLRWQTREETLQFVKTIFWR